MDNVIVCPECFKEFEKWLLIQARHDSSLKLRQTKAYELYERLTIRKDIEVRESK